MAKGGNGKRYTEGEKLAAVREFYSWKATQSGRVGSGRFVQEMGKSYSPDILRIWLKKYGGKEAEEVPDTTPPVQEPNQMRELLDDDDLCDEEEYDCDGDIDEDIRGDIEGEPEFAMEIHVRPDYLAICFLEYPPSEVLEKVLEKVK